jgi:hypothetical protein
MCDFVFYSRTVHDEDYDPVHPETGFRSGARVSEQMARDLQRRYAGQVVLLAGDGHDLQYQLRLFALVHPCTALLQLQPPYRFGAGIFQFIIFHK